MKVLFVHSHRFKEINDEVFSSGGLPDKVLSRYIEVFGELTVLARIEKESQISSRYSKITLPVKFLDYREMSKKRLFKLLQSVDCIIARVPCVISNKVIAYAKRQGKPCLIEVVGCAWDSLWNHSWKGKVIALPLFLAMRRAVRNAKYAIYVTNEFLQRRYPCHGYTEACSDVELQPFDEKILEKRIDRIKKQKGKLVVGTAGALNVRYKGQEYVIKALSSMKLRGLDAFEYQMIGGGSADYLESLAKKHGVIDDVKIIGTLPHHEIFSWFDELDIYIQPSRTEGLPRALIEAMSRGLPCYATKTGGIPELLSDQFLLRKGAVINDLINLMGKTKVDDYLHQARCNFFKSMRFETKTLYLRRRNFLEKFAESIETTR